MAKIIIEIVSSHGSKRDLRAFDRDSVRIGRGYSNDLILQDPYVSAEHLLIKVSEAGQLSVEDLNSYNGSFILSEQRVSRKKERLSESTEIVSGGSLSLGNTIIRVFYSGYTVAPAKALGRAKTSKFSVHRKMTVWYALTGYFLFYFFNAAAGDPHVNLSVVLIVFMEGMILLGMIIWSGIWALIGRVIRHKVRFRPHLTLTCLFFVIVIFIGNICGYAGFIFADPRIEFFSSMILYSVFAWIFLYGHMTYATFLSVRARVLSSAIVPVVVCLIVAMGYFSFRDRVSLVPIYYPRLKPPILRPVKTYSIDGFVEYIGKVFDAAREESKKNK